MEHVLFFFLYCIRIPRFGKQKDKKRSRRHGIFMELIAYAFFSGTQIYTFMSPEPSSGGR